MEHRFAELGGVRLHYVEAGSGPLTVLLHGFPDFWYSWRYQIPALVEAGFRVVAPDMRGYNLSSKPKGVKAYDVDVLALDVLRLIEHCGEESASVVGHDWGAIVAWHLAMRHGQAVDRLAIMNVPHPSQFLRALRTPPQLLRSWYVLFFQLPFLPEASLRARDYLALRAVYTGDSMRPGAFTPEDVELYVEAMAQPGALAGSINYYRALARRTPWALRSSLRRIDQPVLVIWGEQDRYLERSLAAPDRRWVPNLEITYLSDASHWVHMDRPERVNELMIRFLHG